MNNIEKLNENLFLEVLDEKDTKDIINFIERYKQSSNNYLNLSKNILINNAISSTNYYSDIVIRYGLYNFQEEYICLKDCKNNIKILLTFSVPTNKSKVFDFNLMIVENINLIEINNLKVILDFCKRKFNQISLINPSKLRINIANTSKYYDFWKKILSDLGFELESVNKKENFDSLVLYINQ